MKKTITYRFNKFKSKNIGAIPTLLRSVRGMKFGKGLINSAFNKFVPKGEYVSDEKDMILEDLYKQSDVGQEAEITLINKETKND